MARKKIIPEYKTVKSGDNTYYRTRIRDTSGKRIALYGRTPEELYDKVEETKRNIEDIVLARTNPTVEQYCKRWLYMQSAFVMNTTLNGYTWAIKKYIIEPLGNLYVSEVTQDDIKIALVPLAKKSVSIYRTVNMLLKCIFNSAEENDLLRRNPTRHIPAQGGIPQKEKDALTDEQVQVLLDAIRGLPPYVFVMIGIYAGLRREEILGLKWDCVFLDEEAPYIAVRRAWRTEHNRPIVSDQLKTKSSRRDVPIPDNLVECLREAKKNSKSDFVVPNRDGEPLSYTQFQRVWKYIRTRSTKERCYYRYINGERIRYTVTPVLGTTAKHNTKVVYTIDFDVTPHMLRHTYITNLVSSSVDPKTVQYLAGHKNSKITMDIYAKVKYNRPQELVGVVNKAFERNSFSK